MTPAEELALLRRGVPLGRDPRIEALQALDPAFSMDQMPPSAQVPFQATPPFFLNNPTDKATRSEQQYLLNHPTPDVIRQFVDQFGEEQMLGSGERRIEPGRIHGPGFGYAGAPLPRPRPNFDEPVRYPTLSVSEETPEERMERKSFRTPQQREKEAKASRKYPESNRAAKGDRLDRKPDTENDY